jgi:hypothetical protein
VVGSLTTQKTAVAQICDLRPPPCAGFCPRIEIIIVFI